MASKLARQIEDILAELSPDAVFPSTEGQAFITLPTQQTFPLLDPIVQDWLTHRYTHREGTPPNEIAVRQAISTLKARAYCTTREQKSPSGPRKRPPPRNPYTSTWQTKKAKRSKSPNKAGKSPAPPPE